MNNLDNTYISEDENIKLYNGDCLEVMKDIPDGSIDMILCDLPYGTTQCKWDNIIPFEPLWEQYERIITNTGVIVLFGSQPFTTKLINSKIELFKYEWIWKKNLFNSGFAHAKNKPMKKHENILIFSKGNVGHLGQVNNRSTYNPQGLIEIEPRNRKNYTNTDVCFSKSPSHKDTVQKFSNYPISIIEFDYDEKDFIKGTNRKLYHSTQKPLSSCEYLINTYSNENDLVLDNCLGSGSTGIASMNLNRKFIGIELDNTYFNIAKERIISNIKL